jgi:predicted AAA+ superfamily ATPase
MGIIKHPALVGRRAYMDFIKPFIGQDLIKVITGIRRCGKSCLLKLIQEELIREGARAEDMLYLNFEEMANASLRSADALNAYVREAIKGKKEAFLFFDEIQEVRDWERCVNSLRAGGNADIYITGSNAALLSGELTTVLAGRYKEVRVYPFSFAEFRELLDAENMKQGQQPDFELYLRTGGMPFLRNLHFEEEASREYLLDIYNSVVLKDIVQRGNIRDADLLDRLILYCIRNIGQTFSANSLSRFLKNERRKPASETLLNYMRATENALLFYRAPRQDLAGKSILTINEKFYAADHGLCRAVCGPSAIDINLILENIVYMELLRRGYSVTVGKGENCEVDFVAQKQGQKAYYQVAYLLASQDTIEREFKPLSAIHDNYPKYILSLDTVDFSRDGIVQRSIPAWLME